ncbi:MAG: tyrosine-type recombinase/integrase [Segatella copri]
MIIKRNIIFWLEKRKKNGIVVEENMPISMRLTFNSTRINFSTGFRIDASKWDEQKQRVKNGCTNKAMQSAAEINTVLNQYEAELHSIFKKFETLDTMPTKDQVKEAFNRMHLSESAKEEGAAQLEQEEKKAKRPRPSDVMREFISENETINQWTWGTIEKFNAIENHFKDFNARLTLDEYDKAHLAKFVQFLIDKKDMRNSTVKKQLGYLKWFFRWCQEKGYCNCGDYQSFDPKLKTTPKKVIFLDEHELEQLETYEIPENKKYLERVRDVFLFCCYSSLRYSDVYNLKRSDIQNNKMLITTIKTHDDLAIELNKTTTALLKKYADCDFPDNKALPVITNQKMNDYLKELCELAGIDTPISEVFYKGGVRHEITTPKYALMSTHAGRRTFICKALSMNIPPEVVMKWTGHSDYKAMKPYIAVADKVKADAMKLFDK